jgi:integrase
VTGMKPPTREQARDRILTDHELRRLGRACAAGGRPFGPLVRLLILTAQRRDEVACLERAELDLDKRSWTMPREKAKNNRTHPVHLSASAIEVLNSIPGVGVNFVFTSTGSTPVSGFSRAKRRIDEAMLTAKREEMGEKCDPFPAGSCAICAAQPLQGWPAEFSAARRRQGAEPCQRHDPQRGPRL